MRNFIYVALLTSVPTSALADWWWYGSNKENLFFIQRSSLARSGNFVSYWTRAYNRLVQPDGHKYEVVRWTVDCTTRRDRLDSMTLYKGSGEVVSTSGASANFEYVVPDSFGDVATGLVCNDDGWTEKATRIDDISVEEADKLFALIAALPRPK